jgi:transcriptional regulator with XRE-family HTH domain
MAQDMHGVFCLGERRMKRLTRLRLKLLEKGLTQREVARKAGMTEGLMSLIVNGRFIPDEQQKEKIAKAVGLPEVDLFVNSDCHNFENGENSDFNSKQ